MGKRGRVEGKYLSSRLGEFSSEGTSSLKPPQLLGQVYLE